MIQGRVSRKPDARWAAGARSTGPFSVDVTESGQMALARVLGPLDVQTTPEFMERVEPYCGPAARLVLDLRQADYVDSAGVRALLQLHERLEGAQGELRLVIRADSRVERVLGLLRLTDRFHIYANAMDAWVRRSSAS